MKDRTSVRRFCNTFGFDVGPAIKVSTGFVIRNRSAHDLECYKAQQGVQKDTIKGSSHVYVFEKKPVFLCDWT